MTNHGQVVERNADGHSIAELRVLQDKGMAVECRQCGSGRWARAQECGLTEWQFNVPVTDYRLAELHADRYEWGVMRLGQWIAAARKRGRWLKHETCSGTCDYIDPNASVNDAMPWLCTPACHWSALTPEQARSEGWTPTPAPEPVKREPVVTCYEWTKVSKAACLIALWKFTNGRLSETIRHDGKPDGTSAHWTEADAKASPHARAFPASEWDAKVEAVREAAKWANGHRWSRIDYGGSAGVCEYKSAREYRCFDNYNRQHGGDYMVFAEDVWLSSPAEREITQAEAEAIIAEWRAKAEVAAREREGRCMCDACVAAREMPDSVTYTSETTAPEPPVPDVAALRARIDELDRELEAYREFEATVQRRQERVKQVVKDAMDGLPSMRKEGASR